MAKSYRELMVWQRAIELSVALYQLTRGFPGDELYGLSSQLRRAGSRRRAISLRGTGAVRRRTTGIFCA